MGQLKGTPLLVNSFVFALSTTFIGGITDRSIRRRRIEVTLPTSNLITPVPTHPTSWMPFARKCSPSNLRLISSLIPLTSLKLRPRMPIQDPTNMIVISVIWERRSLTMMLMEDEAKKADSNLAETVTKLALASKEADGIMKKVKYFENKTMRNEVELEELDKILRETTKMASDNEQKLDELTRKFGVQEDELKRALERAELAESKLKDVEHELEAVGENMKQLEISAEKATEREEKLKDKIFTIMDRLKQAEARYEYGEMNITKLNHRIDDIEDEIYREKLKIKKVSDELNETFDDMLDNY